MRKRNIEKERAWYAKNSEKARAQARKWAQDNKERRNKKRRETYAENRGRGDYKARTRTGKRYIPKRIKREVIDHYGGICACCGELNLAFLSIDHINDNGREHGGVRHRYKGEALYRHLKKLGYPLGIQIYCLNCNIGKRNNKGICPHKDERAII